MLLLGKQAACRSITFLRVVMLPLIGNCNFQRANRIITTAGSATPCLHAVTLPAKTVVLKFVL